MGMWRLFCCWILASAYAEQIIGADGNEVHEGHHWRHHPHKHKAERRLHTAHISSNPRMLIHSQTAHIRPNPRMRMSSSHEDAVVIVEKHHTAAPVHEHLRHVRKQHKVHMLNHRHHALNAKLSNDTKSEEEAEKDAASNNENKEEEKEGKHAAP